MRMRARCIITRRYVGERPREFVAGLPTTTIMRTRYAEKDITAACFTTVVSRRCGSRDKRRLAGKSRDGAGSVPTSNYHGVVAEPSSSMSWRPVLGRRHSDGSSIVRRPGPTNRQKHELRCTTRETDSRRFYYRRRVFIVHACITPGRTYPIHPKVCARMGIYVYACTRTVRTRTIK